MQERILMAELQEAEAEALVSGLKIHYNDVDRYRAEFGYRRDKYNCCAVVYVRYFEISAAKRLQMIAFCQGICHGLQVMRELVAERVRDGYYSLREA